MFAEKHEIEERTLSLLETPEGKRKLVELLIQGLNREALSSLLRRLSDAQAYDETPEDLEFSKLVGLRNYSKDERALFEIAAMIQHFEYRRQLLANSFTATQVAEFLGTSRQTPHDRVKAGQLLGILDNNVWKFPEWQFDPAGPNGVVEGFPEVVSALKCGPLAKISWFASPNVVFDKLRPIDALKTGRKDEVLQEAAAVGVQ